MSKLKLDVISAARTMEQIAKLESLRAEGVPLLPVKVTDHYKRLVEREVEALGGIGGPLYSVVYPIAERFSVFGTHEPTNFVDDFGHMPEGLERVIVHRYPKKLLYFPTDDCVSNCQYCFRPDVTGVDVSLKNRHRNLEDDVLDKVVRYLDDHPNVQEVIFSGGDPLACKVGALDHALTRILATPTVKWVRFHTKAPIFAPQLLSEPLLDMLQKHRVKLVLHALHPYELDAKLERPLLAARQRGILVFNQFPLLRGINDHADVIIELAYRCMELGVQMLTMFIADPIKYGAVYRLRLQRAYDIADEVFLRSEGWASNFRVCLDSEIGKLKREHIFAHHEREDAYVFEREGARVTYYDIPRELDVPTPLSKLLHRRAVSSSGHHGAST